MNIVDSCGWLEYFADTKYAEQYESIISDHQKLVVPTICIAEVFKKVTAEKDEVHALKAIAAMKQGHVADLTEDIAINAGKTSLMLKIPLADSIIYATAKKYNAKIYTQDNDFRKLESVIIIEKK
ncbi:MAG: type II toxin-antitoxin system VapC family toxin [Spirochaetota bacterium]